MKEIIRNTVSFIFFEKKDKYKVILFCFAFFFISCNNPTDKEKADIIIEKLTERCPELNKGDSDYYKLIRSVAFDNNNFEIQLRTEPDSINDRQSILVFINSKKEYYAIPFLSNSHVDYWQFPNEQSLKGNKKSSFTFNKELRNALLFLKRDKKTDLFNVAEEMRHTLLYCSDIREKDSLVMNTPLVHLGDHLVGNEKEEEVGKRLRKNYLEIKRNSRKYVLFQENFVVAYLDPKNFRVYQFIYHRDGTFSIKCFRQDQKINMTYL
ncbi:hypothetical protein [Flavobacterium tructae]|uniref:hypothetical protein n=1 Tax=Flavobacterium tructae TaxID=1114873 RepID=UPI0035A963DD